MNCSHVPMLNLTGDECGMYAQGTERQKASDKLFVIERRPLSSMLQGKGWLQQKVVTQAILRMCSFHFSPRNITLQMCHHLLFYLLPGL